MSALDGIGSGRLDDESSGKVGRDAVTYDGDGCIVVTRDSGSVGDFVETIFDMSY